MFGAHVAGELPIGILCAGFTGRRGRKIAVGILAPGKRA
jgi:hypothetical protein